MPTEYAIALACGFIYAVAAVISKRALDGEVGVARMTALFNWIMFACFLPFLAFVEEAPNWDAVIWPITSGVLFFIGQVTTFAAIRVGHVSVQAPVMGTKMVFVAAFSILLGAGTIPSSWWIGAGLSMIGIFLLSSGKMEMRRSTYFAIGLALFSCICFALADVIVGKHANEFSISVFPIFMMGVNALLSFGIIPFFHEGFGKIKKEVWPWFAGGGFIFAIQATMLYLSMSYYGNPTPINILYSSRGIWSVVFVWAIGHWVGNMESKDAGHVTMFKRLIGAMLMLSAIFLVLMDGSPEA